MKEYPNRQNSTTKLEKISDRITRLKRQKRMLENREKEQSRKARTRRLVQNGALAEKYLNAEGMPPEDFEKLLHKIAHSTKHMQQLNDM